MVDIFFTFCDTFVFKTVSKMKGICQLCQSFLAKFKSKVLFHHLPLSATVL